MKQSGNARRPSEALAAVLGVCFASQALAQCNLEERRTLLREDPAEFELFGYSIGVMQNHVVVGAMQDGYHGHLSGAAYVFETATGVPISKFAPANVEGGDLFGISLAAHGARVLIGAIERDGFAPYSGAAYLYDLSDPANPLLLHEFLALDAEFADHLGGAVGLAERVAIAGASDDDNNGTHSGSAYLFETSSGRQLSKLLASDGQDFDSFGTAVALAPGVAIVGASGDDDNGSASGCVYIFDISDPEQPVEIAIVRPDDSRAGQRFGYSVAAEGTTLVVGAYRDDGQGYQAGAAYLFDISDPTQPRQLARILPHDSGPSQDFGHGVAISGDRAVFGARRDSELDVAAGAAYVFDISDRSNPIEVAKLLASDGKRGDIFGFDVSIRGTTVAVGAPYRDWQGHEAGAVYVFDTPCGPVLASQGDCPGEMRFTITGAAPNADVAMLYASGLGGMHLPLHGSCPGTTLGLDPTVQLASMVRTDANGHAQLVATVPAQGCGRVVARAVDLSSCLTSNTLPVE